MRGNDSNETAVTIRTLAARHNVSYVETTTDVWVHNVTRLAGDDIQLDEIELLLSPFSGRVILAVPMGSRFR